MDPNPSQVHPLFLPTVYRNFPSYSNSLGLKDLMNLRLVSENFNELFTQSFLNRLERYHPRSLQSTEQLTDFVSKCSSISTSLHKSLLIGPFVKADKRIFEAQIENLFNLIGPTLTRLTYDYPLWTWSAWTEFVNCRVPNLQDLKIRLCCFDQNEKPQPCPSLISLSLRIHENDNFNQNPTLFLLNILTSLPNLRKFEIAFGFDEVKAKVFDFVLEYYGQSCCLNLEEFVNEMKFTKNQLYRILDKPQIFSNLLCNFSCQDNQKDITPGEWCEFLGRVSPFVKQLTLLYYDRTHPVNGHFPTTNHHSFNKQLKYLELFRWDNGPLEFISECKSLKEIKLYSVNLNQTLFRNEERSDVEQFHRCFNGLYYLERLSFFGECEGIERINENLKAVLPPHTEVLIKLF